MFSIPHGKEFEKAWTGISQALIIQGELELFAPIPAK
jgi:hypothetical protein